MPRLSVLMPAHNAAPTIDRAVRSTLRAMPADAELVVLDDGSTDDTAAVLAAHADARLRVLHQDNRGVAAALNTLLASTDSLLVARMDADDVCLPHRFRRQITALRSADLVFTTVRHWDGTRRPRVARPRGLSTPELPYHLLLTNPVAHSTMLGRRAAIASVGGYRALPSEDYDLWLRLAESDARMCRLALPGLVYRSHEGQVTAAPDWRTRSWLDPQIGRSFATLAQALIGHPAMRLTSLSVASLSDAEKLDRLEHFSHAFRRAITGLPAMARRRLELRLRERERWLRGALARDGARPDPSPTNGAS